MQHLSVAKSVPITERVRFTFTTAISNVLNHPNFLPPAANISAPASVGVIQDLVGGGRSRKMELRGRLDF